MILFLYGPNTYASRRELGRIMQKYVEKSGGDFGLERFDGESVLPNQIAPALTASPFLSSSRLVVLQYISRNKPAAEAALKVLDHVPETTVAVFYEAEVDQRTVFFKTLKQKARPVFFDSLSSAQLAVFTQKLVNQEGGSIDRAAVTELIERVGDDQWRLEQEIMKLVSHSPEVTAAKVRLLVAPSLQEGVFDLVDAIAARNSKRALEVFHALISERTNELYILTMIIWQLRNLLLAKTAGPISPGELSKQAKMSPFVAGKMLDRQRSYTEDALKRAFTAAVDTDYAIKTGQGEPQQLVEALIVNLTLSKN